MSAPTGQDPKDPSGQDPKTQGQDPKPSGTGQAPTVEELQAQLAAARSEIKDLRKESAERRLEAKELREELDKAKTAGNGDLTKLEEKVKTLEESASAASQRVIDAELTVAAHKAGFLNPDAAIKLIDRTKLVVDGSDVKNAGDLLADLAKAEPYMVGNQGSGDAAAGAGSPGQQNFDTQLREALARP